METQTLCVIVTVQLVPPSLVTQSTSGVPWQAVLMVPTTAVGVNVTGVETSTHWAAVLLQLFSGHVSSG